MDIYIYTHICRHVSLSLSRISQNIANWDLCQATWASTFRESPMVAWPLTCFWQGYVHRLIDISWYEDGSKSVITIFGNKHYFAVPSKYHIFDPLVHDIFPGLVPSLRSYGWWGGLPRLLADCGWVDPWIQPGTRRWDRVMSCQASSGIDWFAFQSIFNNRELLLNI